MIDVKRYSLDDAVSFIKDKEIKPYSISILLHEAKNNKIQICFTPTNRELRYIQLDKKYDNKRVLFCEHLPPKDKSIPRSVVIPADDERYLFDSDLIVPTDDQVFPLISNSALLTFEINVNNKTATINPSRLNALDEDGNIIEIAIVEGKWILNNAKLAKWLDEQGYPKKYNGGYYYETLDYMEIDRSELCIPAQELKGYIERILVQKNRPSQPIVPIQAPEPVEKTTKERKIKNEWIETGNVTRPTQLVPRKNTPSLYSNTHHADECLDIFYKENGFYPTKKELWTVILHSDEFATECGVVCKRFHVVVENNDNWGHPAYLLYYGRRLK